MKLRPRARACLAAFLVLATTLSGSWAVVCIGDDGHRAIEWAHPAAACGTSPAPQDGAVEAGAMKAGADRCFDLPVAGLGIVTDRTGFRPAAPPATDSPGARSAAPDEAPAHARGTAAGGIDPSHAAAVSPSARLRGVVLLN